MLLNLNLFDWMFPNYSEFKTPMWSTWKEEGNNLILSVAVPGYEKEDFELFFKDGSLKLRIKSDKGDLFYSILDQFYTAQYDLDSVEAEYHSGVLKISIPKAAKKKLKQLPIKIS